MSSNRLSIICTSPLTCTTRVTKPVASAVTSPFKMRITRFCLVGSLARLLSPMALLPSASTAACHPG
eukprot:1380135-Prorocentrum_lima.AAC.1